MRNAGLVALLILLGACTTAPEPVICTMEARSSFAVTVVDSASGENLAPSATVRVTQGTFADTLPAPPGAGVYSGGVYERDGDFTITVMRAGYAPWQGLVRVARDECHVITEAVTVRLRRS
ncbi:MAG TPA: hypothetical protein VK939_11580 [Longimicrobiales bacterium]|nr:hypothetical protein [Longimicrobiales bacterium]